jgi:NAD(P)-dependent dehydrogenase (short-subunit alcohol dehydrogenase family)
MSLVLAVTPGILISSGSEPSVLYLASAAASFTTGALLPVDGGYA